MTPELNKTRGRTADDAESDATKRINPGVDEPSETASRNGQGDFWRRFERHICVPGMGAREASRKSRLEPQRA